MAMPILIGNIEPGLELEKEMDFPNHSQPKADMVYHRENWGIVARVEAGVSFEEYRHWAAIERELEIEENKAYIERNGPWSIGGALKGRFSKGVHEEKKKDAIAARQASEKDGVVDTSSHVVTIPEEEWRTAARALRTASWGTIFYLITTDILGWGGTANVFATVGYGTAVGLYIIFGIAAGFSGWILWKVFLGLDSARFPLVSYGDVFYRVYGAKSRHFINITQSIQQFMTVAVLTLGSGQIIAQLSSSKICYIVCILIFAIFGAIVGSIRSLQRLGWLANASVWMNVASFIIIMVAACKFVPDYEFIFASTLIKTIEPVKTFVGAVPDAYQQSAYGFAASLTGVDNMVYSFGGALLFIAFLAEMRHPLDFWKGLLVAQLFIIIVYIMFGAVVYSQFGQYSSGTISQAITPFRLQTVSNVFSLLTGAIACLLYMNIGLKTFYVEVCEAVFKFPTITTKKGQLMWYALGPVYWTLAFVVGASVPNLNGIATMVGGLLILNFTYTFPAILYVGYRCQIDAALPGEGFDPATGITIRHDSGFKRWIRAYKVNWLLNTVNVIYFMGGLACSGMGTYASIESLITIFGPGGTIATSWGCTAPV